MASFRTLLNQTIDHERPRYRPASVTPNVALLIRPLDRRYSSVLKGGRHSNNVRTRFDGESKQGFFLVEGLKKYQERQQATSEMQKEKTKVCLLYDKIQSMQLDRFISSIAARKE